jgi:DHA2 family multidrug resistance protein
MALNAKITEQAAIVAYIDDFYFMLITTVLTLPLLLLVRPPAKRAPAPAQHVAME